jgi:Replication-relaxation
LLRFLLWRMLAVLASLLGFELLVWFLRGGPGRVLRGQHAAGAFALSERAFAALPERQLGTLWRWAPAAGIAPARLLAAGLLAAVIIAVAVRAHTRRRRRYVRLRIDVYRMDWASAEAVARLFAALHKRLQRRWWQRIVMGQPSLALEVHHSAAGGTSRAWLAVACPRGSERMIEATLQGSYPNCRLLPAHGELGTPPTVVRLKKHRPFINRVKVLDRFEHQHEPPMNRLLTVMAACGEPAFVQLSMTPAPALFEAFAKRLYKRREAHLSRERREHMIVRDRSAIDDAELRSGLEVQHSPLFFVELRVIAPTRAVCERIASELRVESAENRLVERGTAWRHGVLGIYDRRVRRGEGNPLPPFHKGVFAPTELAAVWQLPSIDYLAVPFARSSLPLAPAPPGIWRPPHGGGTLRDAHGGVSIQTELRKQNTAVPGTVEQGKSSYLVATVAEDVDRQRCAVIVLDPKGDAADAAISIVPAERTCTVLDFAHPTCGFNPLAVDAPADVIADYVVAALKNLFTDADIRASSDRYLRNAIIAVLAHDRRSTLWDAARLLSVGEEGYSYRSSVGARLRTLPEFKEISAFFTAELSAQLADARSTTTAKLDAPVNKLARLLNSPSIKRVLLNDSLQVDFDQVIAGEHVLIVKGALGAMGAGNTSVLMQLLVGMLDAALARQQDLVPAAQRVAVALKIDEAPMVLHRGFAETMALKRSAGLETVACWQTDAQWIDRDVREQLDALFAHRVYFATASTRDARAASQLTMAEFSDTVRPGVERLSSLGHPDVRLHLPKHHAIVSWSSLEGRQPPFVAQTIPLSVDHDRIALHAANQQRRGGRPRADLRQPHWDRRELQDGDACHSPPASVGGARSQAAVPAASTPQPPAPPTPAPPPALPDIAAGSYRELAQLDDVRSVRWPKLLSPPRPLQPEPTDLEMLALLASMRHVLSTQIHRHFNPGRAQTTTQRRLKRLADAGLLDRFQFHRRDGGGVPMCCLITAEGLRLLDRDDAHATDARHTPRSLEAREREIHVVRARRDVHVVGWALALARLVPREQARLKGPDEAVLHPPQREIGERRVALAPSDLRLPNGRAAHDFQRTDASGARVELERFETVRPDAIIELAPGCGVAPQAAAGPDAGRLAALDLLVDFDDRVRDVAATAKLERYDHFLAGWSLHTARYGRRMQAVPVVAFVCRDRARARACALAADGILGACRAYAGEYPFDWEYPGREAVLFVAERDVHEGSLHGYGVPRLPPAVRVAAAHGDPRAGETSVESRELLSAGG